MKMKTYMYFQFSLHDIPGIPFFKVLQYSIAPLVSLQSAADEVQPS